MLIERKLKSHRTHGRVVGIAVDQMKVIVNGVCRATGRGRGGRVVGFDRSIGVCVKVMPSAVDFVLVASDERDVPKTGKYQPKKMQLINSTWIKPSLEIICNVKTEV